MFIAIVLLFSNCILCTKTITLNINTRDSTNHINVNSYKEQCFQIYEFTATTGNKINKVIDNDIILWQEHRLPELFCHRVIVRLIGGTAKFIFIAIKGKGDVAIEGKFFRERNNNWYKVTRERYFFLVSLQNKKGTPDADFVPIAIDISYSNGTPHFIVTKSKHLGFSFHEITPRSGSKIVQVVDDDSVLWESSSIYSHCTIEKAFLGDKTYLIHIKIIDSPLSRDLFFIREYNKTSKISPQNYSQMLNDITETSYMRLRSNE